MGKRFGVPGIFGMMIILEEDHFCWKDKRYEWVDVVSIKRDDDAIASFVRYPSATVLLSDGKILRIPTIIKDLDAKRSWNFTIFDSRNDYNNLLDYIASKANTTKLYDELLYSCNFSMISRFLIIIGSLFSALSYITFAVFKAKIEFMSLYFVFIALTALTIGSYMILKRKRDEAALLNKLTENRQSQQLNK